MLSSTDTYSSPFNGSCCGSAREVKLPGREAYHSPKFSAEVKNAWRHSSTSPHAFSARTQTVYVTVKWYVSGIRQTYTEHTGVAVQLSCLGDMRRPCHCLS